MGGAQYQAKLLIERMAETGGYDAHYLARVIPGAEYQPSDHTVHRCGTSKNMYMAFDALQLTKRLKELRPDAVYSHVGCAYTGIAAHYCKNNNARLVWHIASDIDVQPWTLGQQPNPIMSFIDKKALEYGIRNSDAIVAQTVWQQEQLRTNYGLEVADLVRNFHPDVTQTIDKTGKPKVLWVANLKDLKQPEKFVELAENLNGVNCDLVMIGGMQLKPSIADSLRAAIANTPNLSHLGPQDQETVNEQFASAHLLVNTSLYEGFSNTFVQAWQRQVPVCSLNVNPDKLLNDNAYLGRCAEGDMQRLTSQVKELVEAPKQLAKMGVASEEYAQTYHSQDNADRLIALF